jgi:hypothetical protein
MQPLAAVHSSGEPVVAAGTDRVDGGQLLLVTPSETAPAATGIISDEVVVLPGRITPVQVQPLLEHSGVMVGHGAGPGAPTARAFDSCSLRFALGLFGAYAVAAGYVTIHVGAVGSENWCNLFSIGGYSYSARHCTKPEPPMLGAVAAGAPREGPAPLPQGQGIRSLQSSILRRI